MGREGGIMVPEDYSADDRKVPAFKKSNHCRTRSLSCMSLVRNFSAFQGFSVIITKSTVPVGTGDEVARIIHETRSDAEVAVVSNPEFLREGAAIQDFKHPDRIVVGSDDDRARQLMEEIYRPLYLNKAPILYTDRC